MRPRDDPRPTPDWMPQAAPCQVCGTREWGHVCDELALPAGIILGEN